MDLDREKLPPLEEEICCLLSTSTSSMAGKRLQEFLLQLPLNSFLAGISRSNLLKVARCRQILTNIPTFSDKSISLLGKS